MAYLGFILIFLMLIVTGKFSISVCGTQEMSTKWKIIVVNTNNITFITTFRSLD